MTKTAQSLASQLRDVALAFCLEVQGKAFNITGVSADVDLRGTDKVYYPQTLRIAPSFASSSPKPTTTLTSTTFAEKEKKQQTPSPMIELGLEEILEVEQLKRKKKEKEKEVAA